MWMQPSLLVSQFYINGLEPSPGEITIPMQILICIFHLCCVIPLFCSSVLTSMPTCSLTWLISVDWWQPKPSPLLLNTLTWSRLRHTNRFVGSGMTEILIGLLLLVQHKRQTGKVAVLFNLCLIFSKT